MLSACSISPINLAIIGIFEYDELAISQRRVKIQDVVDYGAHLLGQHTVRLSPIGYVYPSSLAFFELILLSALPSSILMPYLFVLLIQVLEYSFLSSSTTQKLPRKCSTQLHPLVIK